MTTEEEVLKFLASQPPDPRSTRSEMPTAADVDAFLNPPTAQDEALKRLNARGGSATGDFLRMMAQGATFGFGDELAGLAAAVAPGGKGYAEARDASRQRVQDLRLLNPGASAASEIAGGVAIPLGVTASAVRGAPTVGRGVATAAKVGAVTGGATGALTGFGEGEGDLLSRLAQAVPDAAIGAAAGGSIGALAGPAITRLVRPFTSGRGGRVAESLVTSTGLPKSYADAARAANASVKRVSDEMYKPLEQQFANVADNEILALLKSDVMKPHMQAVKIQTGQRKAVTFDQLQKLRTRLRKQDRDLAGQLDGLMQAKMPGLAEADAAYRQAIGAREAMKQGRKLASKSSDDIALAMEKLSPDAQNAFRVGQLHEIVYRLQQREDKAVEYLNRYLDAGPETKAVLRNLFPDDGTFQRFMAVVKNERRAAKVWPLFKKSAAFGAAGILGGGVVAGAAALR